MRSRCATQYPIVLIHGSGYRDNNKIGYWGRIPAALREEGAQVYCSRQDAWGALETNVELLKDNILHALSDAGADKVNLIAHSRGGIEARQVIHHPMLTGKIASLTTISTPHHGSRTMDALTKPPQWMHKFLSLFVNGWFRLWGDKHPDFFHSSRQFTSAWCEEFNRTCPNDPNIYYQSYASSMSCCRSDWMMAFSYFVIRRVEGENDGLVAADSAAWGEFQGVVSTQVRRGVSHADIVDMRRRDLPGLDIRQFYQTIAEGLKQKGL